MLSKVCNTEHYFHEKFSLEKFPWSNKFRILYYFFQKKKNTLVYWKLWIIGVVIKTS